MFFRKILLAILCIFYISSFPSLAMLEEDEEKNNSFSFLLKNYEEEERNLKEQYKKESALIPTIFREDELKVIRSYSESLYKRTRPEDIVIFVGRSPWIFAYYWQCQSYDRQFYSVSFSGKPYDIIHYPEGASSEPSEEAITNLMKENSILQTKASAISHYKYLANIKTIDDGRIKGPTPQHFEAYAKYLSSLGLKEKLEKYEAKGKIVLVDYTVTGSGIAQFARVLANLKLLNTHLSVVFAITNDLFAQKIMDKPSYSARKAIDSENFPFFYEILADSFIDIAQALSVRAYIGSKLGEWEFSMPGLGKYPLELWPTVNPLNFDKTGDIDLVLEKAKQVWSKLGK